METGTEAQHHDAVVLILRPYQLSPMSHEGWAAPPFPPEPFVEPVPVGRQRAQLELGPEQFHELRHHQRAESLAVPARHRRDAFDVSGVERVAVNLEGACDDGRVSEWGVHFHDDHVPTAECVLPVVVCELACEGVVEEATDLVQETDRDL